MKTPPPHHSSTAVCSREELSQDQSHTTGSPFCFPLARRNPSDHTLAHLLLALLPVLTAASTLIAKTVIANAAERDDDDSDTEEESADLPPPPQENPAATGCPPMLMCSLPGAISTPSDPVGETGPEPASTLGAANLTSPAIPQDDPVGVTESHSIESNAIENHAIEGHAREPAHPTTFHHAKATQPARATPSDHPLSREPATQAARHLAVADSLAPVASELHVETPEPQKPRSCQPPSLAMDLSSPTEATTPKSERRTLASLPVAHEQAGDQFTRPDAPVFALKNRYEHPTPPPPYASTFTCSPVPPAMHAERLRSVLRPFFLTSAPLFSPRALSGEVWKDNIENSHVVNTQCSAAETVTEEVYAVAASLPREPQEKAESRLPMQGSKAVDTRQQVISGQPLPAGKFIPGVPDFVDKPVRPTRVKEDKYARLILTALNAQRTWHPSWALVLLVIVILLLANSHMD